MLRVRELGKPRVVGGMATMPSRAVTLKLALPSILAQVDRLIVYLDGHEATPSLLLGDERIVPILSRAAPGLRAKGKFLPLELEAGDFLYAGFDDDIAYPTSHVDVLTDTLKRSPDAGVAGFHGVILKQPFGSYLKDRRVLQFSDRLRKTQSVDVLGTGTVLFSTERFRPDWRAWKEINMIDLNLALDAAASGVPLVCAARPSGFLSPLSENQDDSCFSMLLRDETEQTALAQQVLDIRAKAKSPAQRYLRFAYKLFRNTP